MAVVKQVAFGMQDAERNSVERLKSGIFSPGMKYTAPNNGGQTTSASGIDPKASRQAATGLTDLWKTSSDSSTKIAVADESGNDWRVRISINPNSKILYWDPAASGTIAGLLAPLKNTDGFIFPYLPQISITHSANYSSVTPTHSNYAQYFYESSTVSSISISADFTVQNLDEAKYFLAGIYYFRALTKMFYGDSDQYQGSPPPIVYLDGYGQHYLPHVSCVVTGFQHTMPNDVDYLEVNTPQSMDVRTISNQTPKTPMGSITLPSVARTSAGSEITTQQINTAFNRVPTFSTFSLTLQPVISRQQAIQFDYAKFARGGMIGGKGNLFEGGYL